MRRRLIPGMFVLAWGCGPSGVSGESESSETASESSAGATESESSGTASGTTSETTSMTTEGTETGDTSPEDPCLLALRIDQCCNSPIPARPDQIAADDCLVAYPVDFDALAPELVQACVAAQPETCQVIDCDFAPPASELVELGDDGECRYLCPSEEESIGYPSAGCGGPGPVAECLPPPPPCADEFCSCAGETVFGCGYVNEPWAHDGPC